MKLSLLFLFLLISPSTPSNCSNFGTLECWPIEIQEMVLMTAGKDIERYNCSGKSTEEWRKTGEVRFWWSIYYTASGLLFQLLGWPVLWIFLTKFSMTHALKVYRVMVFIGIIEITEVWGNSLWPGWVAYFGEVYCSTPRITTIVGKVTMVQWVLGSSTAVFLGIHRLTDMSRKGEFLVNTNWKTAFWIFCLSIYAFYGSIFYDTVLFNSVYMAPLLDPMIGQNGIVYSNRFLYFHNMFAAVLLITVYASLFGIWRSREMNTSSLHVSKFQRSILLQSICISLTYAIPAISFVTMFVFQVPIWFFHASDITYQLSGGLPFIMYICLNQRVREEFLLMFRIIKNLPDRHKAVGPTGNSTII
ncbi:unnamed protein product [Caenorhabditis brenneri]